MNRRRILAAVLALAVVGATVATAASARQQAPRKTYTIYLIPGIASDAFYTTMHKGAAAEAAKHGIKLVFQGSPTAFSPPTQIPFLNAAIARKPDAILIAPTDKTALIAPIKKAIAAGIPVFTVDTFISSPIAISNVSSDNVAGGKAAAKALAQAIGNKGSRRRDQRGAGHQHHRPAQAGLRVRASRPTPASSTSARSSTTTTRRRPRRRPRP